MSMISRHTMTNRPNRTPVLLAFHLYSKEWYTMKILLGIWRNMDKQIMCSVLGCCRQSMIPPKKICCDKHCYNIVYNVHYNKELNEPSGGLLVAQPLLQSLFRLYSQIQHKLWYEGPILHFALTIFVLTHNIIKILWWNIVRQVFAKFLKRWLCWNIISPESK